MADEDSQTRSGHSSNYSVLDRVFEPAYASSAVTAAGESSTAWHHSALAEFIISRDRTNDVKPSSENTVIPNEGMPDDEEPANIDGIIGGMGIYSLSGPTCRDRASV